MGKYSAWDSRKLFLHMALRFLVKVQGSKEVGIVVVVFAELLKIILVDPFVANFFEEYPTRFGVILAVPSWGDACHRPP